MTNYKSKVLIPCDDRQNIQNSSIITLCDGVIKEIIRVYERKLFYIKRAHMCESLKKTL